MREAWYCKRDSVSWKLWSEEAFYSPLSHTRANRANRWNRSESRTLWAYASWSDVAYRILHMAHVPWTRLRTLRKRWLYPLYVKRCRNMGSTYASMKQIRNRSHHTKEKRKSEFSHIIWYVTERKTPHFHWHIRKTGKWCPDIAPWTHETSQWSARNLYHICW